MSSKAFYRSFLRRCGKFAALALAGALISASRRCPAESEPYTFFVSGYPAATQRSTRASDGIGITSGTLSNRRFFPENPPLIVSYAAAAIILRRMRQDLPIGILKVQAAPPLSSAFALSAPPG